MDKIILDACCGSRMFWFNKKHPNAIFADIRDEEHISSLILVSILKVMLMG